MTFHSPALKPILIIFFLAIFGLQVHSQDIKYARTVLDTLCSPAMHGRGYVNSGDKIAGNYIRKEFKKIGLTPASRKFKQKFFFSVNSLPGELTLVLDEQKLRPGYDYLVHPGSPSIDGEFSVLQLNEFVLLDRKKALEMINDASGKFLIISPSQKTLTKEEQKEIREFKNFLIHSGSNPAAGTILLTPEKLTWHGSTVELAKPSFTLKIDSIVPDYAKVTVHIDNKFIKKHVAFNVIGSIKGTEKPDSTLVLTAHYDHLGRMGTETYFPGANDNASGVAMLLNMAKHFSTHPPKYTMVFIAFAGEEVGLLGSQFYCKSPLFPLDRIKFLINFDISGTGDEGIQVVNGSIFKSQFNRLVDLNSSSALLKQVKIRGESCNSDHCKFYEKGVPSFFIYTLGGIKAYHDVYDKSETLPFTDFEDYFKLMLSFIDGF